MIKRKGNLFDTDALHIGHGVNCQGVMGSGIAVEFRNRMHNTYNLYKEKCDAHNKDWYRLRPGEDFVVADSEIETGRKRWVHNISSQYYPGKDARLPWLFSGLTAAANNVYNSGDQILAIPLIGCGIGGLDPTDLMQCIGAIEEFVPIEFEVWKFE